MLQKTSHGSQAFTRVGRALALAFFALASVFVVGVTWQGTSVSIGFISPPGGLMVVGAVAAVGCAAALLCGRGPRVRRADPRAGQVLVMCTVALVVVVAVAALAVDVGYLFATQARLQNAADAASRAAILELWERRASSDSESDARTAARTESTHVARENYDGVGVDTEFGVWDGSSFTPCDSETCANAVRVRAYLDETAPAGSTRTFFAGVLGLHDVGLSATAVARYQQEGLLPFGIYRGDIGAVGTNTTLYDDTEVAPGAFGLIDFNGGENSADDMKNWTRNGYKDWFYIDPAQGTLTVEGCTGLKSSLADAIYDHIASGKKLVAPIYDSISGTGDSTRMGIVGYVEIVITDLTWADAEKTDIKSISCTTYAKHIVGSGYTEGTMRDFMELSLVQ